MISVENLTQSQRTGKSSSSNPKTELLNGLVSDLIAAASVLAPLLILWIISSDRRLRLATGMTLPRDYKCCRCKRCMEMGQKMSWSNKDYGWLHSPACPPKYVSSTFAADVAGRRMRNWKKHRYSQLVLCQIDLAWTVVVGDHFKTETTY